MSLLLFDAVGTLIHPQPSVGAVYHDIGRKHGSLLERDEVRRRFHVAFQREEDRDRAAGHRTDEAREFRRWQAIVADVFGDDRSFAELYAWFGQPHAWRCTPGTAELFEELHRAGHRLAIGSNFDRRLHDVVAGLPELKRLERVFVSSELGVRKPHADFFAAIGHALGARDVVVVGDDPVNDYEGATQAGLRAVLVERDDWPAQFPGTLTSLGIRSKP